MQPWFRAHRHAATPPELYCRGPDSGENPGAPGVSGLLALPRSDDSWACCPVYCWNPRGQDLPLNVCGIDDRPIRKLAGACVPTVDGAAAHRAGLWQKCHVERGQSTTSGGHRGSAPRSGNYHPNHAANPVIASPILPTPYQHTQICAAAFVRAKVNYVSCGEVFGPGLTGPSHSCVRHGRSDRDQSFAGVTPRCDFPFRFAGVSRRARRRELRRGTPSRSKPLNLGSCSARSRAWGGLVPSP